MDLSEKVKEYLNELYSELSGLQPTLKQLEDEVSEIVNEINACFSGDFNKWKKYEDEQYYG